MRIRDSWQNTSGLWLCTTICATISNGMTRRHSTSIIPTCNGILVIFLAVLTSSVSVVASFGYKIEMIGIWRIPLHCNKSQL